MYQEYDEPGSRWHLMRHHPDKRVSNLKGILVSAIKITFYFNSSTHSSFEVVPQGLHELDNKGIQRLNKEESNEQIFKVERSSYRTKITILTSSHSSTRKWI